MALLKEIMVSRVFVFSGVLAFFILASLAVNAEAQSGRYPNKTVRVIVPYPPGGTTDIVGRLIAQELGKRLGENFIVDNRGGATGQIGTELAAKANPDGYTLLVGASGNVMMQPALAASLPYNIPRDFEPIANVVTVANIMVVSLGSKFTSLKALIDFAKANPRKVRYASGGNGSSGHVAGELLSVIAGIQMLHIPYRGGGLSIVSVISGETDVNFINLPTALPQTRSGKLRGVAVLSPKRATMAPEYPTTVELGFPDFVITSSTGLLAPKGTPKEIVSLLDKTLKAITDTPEVVKQFINAGADIEYMNSAQYRTYIADEIKRFTTLGKKANIVSE